MSHSFKFLLATFVALAVSVMAADALAKPKVPKEPPSQDPILVVSMPDLTSIIPEPAPIEAAKDIVLPANPPEEKPQMFEAATEIRLPANPTEPGEPVDGSTYDRLSFCGNGRLDKDSGEACDDGNYSPWDGCYQCQFECQANFISADALIVSPAGPVWPVGIEPRSAVNPVSTNPTQDEPSSVMFYQ